MSNVRNWAQTWIPKYYNNVFNVSPLSTQILKYTDKNSYHNLFPALLGGSIFPCYGSGS
jgi:hypothetical protein